MRGIIVGSFWLMALAALFLVGQPFQHVPLGIVSDWTHHRLLYPASNNPAVMARIRQDPRWVQNWYLRNPQAWWPQHRWPGQSNTGSHRDWNILLSTSVTGGQTFPAKYVFDVTAAPSCTSDYVAIGVPVTTASTTNANLIAVNNLYSYQGTPSPTPTAFCTTNGPTVMFAYASGTGGVPASVVISPNGKQIAYIENITAGTGAGSSYFHVLTIGTTGSNGTSASAAVVPGTGNNAVDNRLLLSPDGGTTNENSTTTPFVDYADNVAYVDTYGTGTGYIYKIANVFSASPAATPTMVWHYQLPAAYPSTLVYDYATKRIFFTDSTFHIDYLPDNGSTNGTLVQSTGACIFDATVTGPVIVDSTNQLVYGYFESNATNAVIVQAPFSLASCVAAPVGTKSTGGIQPLAPDFNNSWYTGATSPAPLIYASGTGTGELATLYSIGFSSATPGATMLTTSTDLGALASATGADSSPVTEFYNTLTKAEYLFVGITNHCIATTHGGTAGCVLSLNITSGAPTINAGTTAIAAAGGTSGITVDNNSSAVEASSVYYATKTGTNLVKATQSGLQ